MKKLFVFAAVLSAAIAVSCTKNEIARPDEALPSGEAQTVTLTCTLPDTKVAIDDAGKTKWEVDDEIYVHAGENDHVTVKLTSADIKDEGKTAIISFSGLTKYTAGTSYKSSYYMIYPADAASDSQNMFYETRFNKFTEPVIGGYDDGEGHFVTKNLCSVIRFKNLTGDFDSYTFEGTNGETVGYTEYQVRLALTDSGEDYRQTTSNNYAGTNLNAVSGDIATSGSYTYIVVPGNLNLPNGFTLRFKKEGNPVKTLSTSKAFSMNAGDLVDLGDVSAKYKLKDYVPTYTVVGDASLCGSAWNTFDTNNVMTDNGDGTFSKSYNVPAGTYYFKIVKDHQYSNGEWPISGNQQYVANDAGKLTIKFTPSENSISFGFVVAATYTVAGDNTSIFGTAWDETNSDNDMTLQSDDTFVWSKVITGITSPLDIEFKIVKNHNWGTTGEDNWPDGSTNASCSVPCDGTLYIYFNPTNKDITTRFVPKITIDGNMSEWQYVTNKVDGVNSAYLEFRATYDATNLYFYTKRDWRTSLWANANGSYVYYYFADSDPSTGSTATNLSSSVTDIDYYLYFFPFIGTSDAPAFPTSNPDGGGSISRTNITLAGTTDKASTVEIEVCIPRADAHVVSGQTYKIYTYASKDGGDMNHQYITLTLID